MNWVFLLLTGWAGMAAALGILNVIAYRTRNAGIVDVGWSAGVPTLAIYYALMAGGHPYRRLTLALLAGVWGYRLAIYLLTNRVIGRPEDGRYQMLREKFGPKAELFFFGFFQVQALWAVLFSLPMLPVAAHGGPWPVWQDVVGIAIAVTAIVGESLADRQLARFLAREGSRGKTCREGLWRYSRHPNYFFEWVHWFAYPFLAWGTPGWWLTGLGPVLMLLFLFKLTGIPYTEKRALASRGEDYRQYQRTTSAFIPWPPKRDSACES